MASIFKKISKAAANKKARSAHKRSLPLIRPEFSQIKQSHQAIQFLLDNFDFDTVLDVGCGQGVHADAFLAQGKNLTAIDYGRSIYFEKNEQQLNCIIADFNTHPFALKFDCVWASHVLEHQPNPNQFLSKIHDIVKDDGVIAITVPPLKHEIVGGHVTLWNAGLLLYQLVLAGFNCRKASVLKYGYNISVVCPVEKIELPQLSFDNGDIDLLSDFLPQDLSEGFHGDILRLNWHC